MLGKMKKLNTYIVEKLVIDNKVKVPLKESWIPKSEDYERLKQNIFPTIGMYKGYSWYEVGLMANSARNKATCIRLWTAIMLMTNSTPYIYNNTIHSYPGNYGIELINKAIDKYGVTKEEIIKHFKNCNRDEKQKLPQQLKELYYQKIESLLNNTIPKSLQKIELKYYIPEGDFYSKKGKELLDNEKLKVTLLPFELEYNGKKAICEIAFNGPSSKYYHFRTNNKDFMWSQDFLDELKKVLDI